MPNFSGIWGVYHFRGIIDFRRSYFIRRKANNMEKALSVKLSAFSGGRGWIRTTEVVDNRFTVCPLWPLGNSSILNCGAGGRTRTPDLLITNQLLYQLSYTSICIFSALIIYHNTEFLSTLFYKIFENPSKTDYLTLRIPKLL